MMHKIIESITSNIVEYALLSALTAVCIIAGVTAVMS